MIARLAPFALDAGVAALALLTLVLALARPGRGGRAIGVLVCAGLCLLSVAAWMVSPGGARFGGAFVQDDLALFAARVLIPATALGVLATLAMDAAPFVRRSAEYHLALLLSLVGMLVLASARELVLLFVAFELMSIPLYVLTGFQKRSDTGPEAALKFFVVGTVSSALVLYGLSFVYGATGSTDVLVMAAAVRGGSPLVRLGLTIALAGFGFKIAAVPFHMWVPDAYEAAATPFVAWLSVAPKAAGFIVILRLYVEGVGAGALVWLPIVAGLAVVTIGAGNLMAIPQTNLKRLLAYSGIAHIGYMLMGLAALSSTGVATILFYLVAYVFGNMGAFFVVQAIEGDAGSSAIEASRGLARRSPVLALAMLVFLLSLGGIPFVAGFWAKLYVFLAVVARGMYGLAFLGALFTVVALYYYLQVARCMYVDAPASDTPVSVPLPLRAAILVCGLGVVVMGLYPEPWIRAAARIAATLF